ncbi:MAG: efflux RND transporter periplasmic adaptor subunit [Prolixibacteraceae bacterium]|nr:efflux RND transporter periplasmic adaptor subunit [Prolixibacteraceae bacterium]
MKNILFYKYIIIMLLIGFFSCQSTGGGEELFHCVLPTTFSNHIVINGQVDAISTSMVSCPQNVNGTIVFIIEDGTYVEKGDTVCILENRELENRYDNMVANLEQSKANYEKGMANLEMNYALLTAQVESNEAQTSITNLDSVQLQYLSEQQRRIKELEIEKAAIEKEKLQTKLHYLEIINESKLRKLKIKIEQDEVRAREYKKILSGMVLTAPRDGIAKPAQVRWRGGQPVKEGDEVWRGHPLVEIPDVSNVNVSIEATESQFKKISVGDTVDFTFDAMAGNQAWGKIERKAPIGQPVSRGSNVKIFNITASVDSCLSLPEVGISANCKITFNFQKNAIVVPQVAVHQHDSIYVVYVKDNNTYQRREVRKGFESPKETVIVDGLKYNDLVSLIKPDENSVSETIYLQNTETNNKN